MIVRSPINDPQRLLAGILAITIRSMLSWLRSRGVFFALNLGVVLLLIWLVAPLFVHRSNSPIVFGRYSVGYALYLGFWILAIGLYVLVSLMGSGRLNASCFVGVSRFLVVGELYVRWSGGGASSNFPAQDVFRLPQPYVEFAGTPNATLTGPLSMGGSVADSTMTLNALGFRGDLPRMPKGDEVRVIVLGGSAAFNGAPLRNSIAGWLERLAHDAGETHVRVYNWGVTSYVSGQELAVLVN